MTSHHAHLGLKAAALCCFIGLMATSQAATTAGPVEVQAVLQHLQDGDLQQAEALLRALPARSADDASRRDRLQALITQQRQLAEQLLRLATGDLQRQEMPRAVERYETALALDARPGQGHPGEALATARQRLWATRDAVARCLKERDAACMDRTTAAARKLAPRDPAMLLMTLQASGWWQPGMVRQTPVIDGTTGSSR